MTRTFLYFAYGSNLLAQRIQLNNPTAVRKGIGKLENYRLDFGFPFSKRWGGCPATIVPEEGKHVWGALWEIDEINKPDLDRQEGVSNKIYFPIEVEVDMPTGEKLKCRSYQLCSPPPALNPGEQFPNERRPSEVYWRVIIRGAEETGLPLSYIEILKQFPHNGSKGGSDCPVKKICE